MGANQTKLSSGASVKSQEHIEIVVAPGLRECTYDQYFQGDALEVADSAHFVMNGIDIKPQRTHRHYFKKMAHPQVPGCICPRDIVSPSAPCYSIVAAADPRFGQPGARKNTTVAATAEPKKSKGIKSAFKAVKRTLRKLAGKKSKKAKKQPSGLLRTGTLRKNKDSNSTVRSSTTDGSYHTAPTFHTATKNQQHQQHHASLRRSDSTIARELFEHGTLPKPSRPWVASVSSAFQVFHTARSFGSCNSVSFDNDVATTTAAKRFGAKVRSTKGKKPMYPRANEIPRNDNRFTVRELVKMGEKVDQQSQVQVQQPKAQVQQQPKVQQQKKVASKSDKPVVGLYCKPPQAQVSTAARIAARAAYPGRYSSGPGPSKEKEEWKPTLEIVTKGMTRYNEGCEEMEAERRRAAKQQRQVAEAEADRKLRGRVDVEFRRALHTEEVNEQIEAKAARKAARDPRGPRDDKSRYPAEQRRADKRSLAAVKHASPAMIMLPVSPL